MNLKLVVAGLGGQGVVFLTRLIARTALALDHHVMVSENHGMSQRGGSVVSHLKIGGDRSPLILRGTADVLFGLERDEAVRNLPVLRRRGIAFVNTADGLRPEVTAHLERLEIEIACLPASDMAVSLGSSAIANVVLMGLAAAHPDMPFPMDAIQGALAASASRGLEMNLQALEAGYQAGLRLTSQGQPGHEE